MSGNSFVERSGALHLYKKVLGYRITSPFPSRREHSTHKYRAGSMISVHVCAFGFMSTGYASFRWTELTGLHLANVSAIVNIIYQGHNPRKHPKYLFNFNLKYWFANSVMVESERNMQFY